MTRPRSEKLDKLIVSLSPDQKFNLLMFILRRTIHGALNGDAKSQRRLLTIGQALSRYCKERFVE